MYSKRYALVALVSMLGMGGCASITSQQRTDSKVVGGHCEKVRTLDTRVQQSFSVNSSDRPELAFHDFPHSAGASPRYVHGVSTYRLADGDINDAYVDHTLACHTSAGQTHPFYDGDQTTAQRDGQSHEYVITP